MAFQRVPNTVIVTILGLMAGQEVVNTFYAKKTGYTLADVIDLASATDTWVTAHWLPHQATNYSYVQTEVRGLNAAIDVSAVDATGAGAGGEGSVCAANNVALSFKRSSGFTGRGARGRIYVPVPDDQVTTTTNMVSSTWTDAIHAALDEMTSVFAGVDFSAVLVHRVAEGVPLAEAVVFTLVEWVVVDRVLDSMRRRLPRRGV